MISIKRWRRSWQRYCSGTAFRTPCTVFKFIVVTITVTCGKLRYFLHGCSCRVTGGRNAQPLENTSSTHASSSSPLSAAERFSRTLYPRKNYVGVLHKILFNSEIKFHESVYVCLHVQVGSKYIYTVVWNNHRSAFLIWLLINWWNFYFNFCIAYSHVLFIPLFFCFFSGKFEINLKLFCR